MVTILTKNKTRLRVKEVNLPMIDSPILGYGVDVTALPEGHASCPQCGKHLFECWLYGDNHRIEMGCMECNANYRLLFPLDVNMPAQQGRFTCKRHPEKGMVLIHNVDVISIGCESCYTEIDIKLKKAQGLTIAEDLI